MAMDALVGEERALFLSMLVILVRGKAMSDGATLHASSLVFSEDREGLCAFLVRDPDERKIIAFLVSRVGEDELDWCSIIEDDDDDDCTCDCEIGLFMVDHEGIVTVEVDCWTRLRGQAVLYDTGQLREISSW